MRVGLSFDDPKPSKDTRKQVLVFIRPSVKDRIDEARGKLSRSEWIERAVLEKLATTQRSP